jgi:CxxC-x17-CxxC domain-containing protein
MDSNDPQEQVTALARTNFRNEYRKFGIKTDDRRRHVYLIGKTGMGKSTVLENMIIQDIQNGKGLAVVDPHGDLVEKVIDFVPSNRINDVVYFNPADLDFPIAFNVFEKVEREYQHLVASGLIGIFKKLWADSWGPRLEYVLRNAILALLEYPDSTLLGVMKILTDKGYRKKVIQQISDPVVKSFWVDEYSKYPDKFQAEAIAPIQNKVGQFLSSPVIRNIVGQVKSSFSLRDLMDNRKILLVNLSKGRVGEDNSMLLGAMIITKIQMAAMSRVDILEEDRVDFYLYVDEFQNFATESFANILSEARKYRLNLIIAHQYIEQLDELVRAAVFGNVGTMILFRIGAIDAEELVKEFEPQYVEEDLVNLSKYDVYMKLMIDGVSSQAFSASTLPPIEGAAGTREKVINNSRERYSTERTVIEEKIARWVETSSGESPERHESAPQQNRSIPKPNSFNKPKDEQRAGLEVSVVEKKEKEDMSLPFEATCDICSDVTRLSFEPDKDRPIYCKSCLKKVRSGEIPRIESSNKKKPDNLDNKPKINSTPKKEENNTLENSKNIPTPDRVDTGPSVSLSDALSQGVQKFKG